MKLCRTPRHAQKLKGDLPGWCARIRGTSKTSEPMALTLNLAIWPMLACDMASPCVQPSPRLDEPLQEDPHSHAYLQDKARYLCSSYCPKTLVLAFGLRLRSKTQRSETRVLGRRLPNGKPQERLRFRDLQRIAIISCVLEASLGARACV